MQNRKFNILPLWISTLIVGCFILHFSLLLIHQFGKDYVPQPVAVLSERYIVPWFYQNYKLFAPDPPTHFNTFLYRFQTRSGWSLWQDPGKPYLNDHWQNRMGNDGALASQFQGVADDLFEGIQTVQFNPYAEDNDWFRLAGYNNALKYLNKHVPRFTDEETGVFQVAVQTHYLVIEESDRIVKRNFLQPYPIDSLNRSVDD